MNILPYHELSVKVAAMMPKEVSEVACHVCAISKHVSESVSYGIWCSLLKLHVKDIPVWLMSLFSLNMVNLDVTVYNRQEMMFLMEH